MALRSFLAKRSDAAALAEEQRQTQQAGGGGGGVLAQLKSRCTVM